MIITIKPQSYTGKFQEKTENFDHQYNYAKNVLTKFTKEQTLLGFLGKRNISIGLQPLNEKYDQSQTTGRYEITDEYSENEFILIKFKINAENLLLSETFLKTCFSHEAGHSFMEFGYLLKNQKNNFIIKNENEYYLKCIEYFCDEFAAKAVGRDDSVELLNIKIQTGENPNHPSWQNRVNAVKFSVFSDLVDNIIKTANKKEQRGEKFNSWKFFVKNKESIVKTISELEK